MSSLTALPFSRNQRRSFTPRTQTNSTTPAMGRKKVIGHTDVLGMVPLSASLSCGRYPRTALWIHFRNVFQQVTLFLLLVLKEDPLSSLLEEKKSEQLGLPQTLQQEFSLINVQIRNVNVEVLRFSVSHTCGWWPRGLFQPRFGLANGFSALAGKSLSLLSCFLGFVKK